MPLVEPSASVAVPAAASESPSPEEPPADAEDQEDEKKGKDEPEGVKTPVGVGIYPGRAGRKLSAHRNAVRDSESVLVRTDGDEKPEHQNGDQNPRNQSLVHTKSPFRVFIRIV